MKSRFPIVFATDNEYAPHMASAIYSLLETNSGLSLRLVVITSDLRNLHRTRLKSICEKFETPLEFFILPDSEFSGLKINHHFKKAAYYRLFIPEIIEEEKCLYLDADVIVTKSIEEFFATDIRDVFLAAVDVPWFNRHEELGMNLRSRYFCSGVMLINVKKWRDTKLKDRVVEFVEKNPDVIELVDQCGTNAIVDGRWIVVPPTYGFLTSMLTKADYENPTIENLPAIIHFSGGSKPWHLNNRHPYKKMYWHFRKKTPYRAYLPDDFGPRTLVTYLTPASVKNLIKRLIIKVPK